ncbi:Up-regulated during skeletal muscle growth protein 5 [Liparis tanakae]|uniref:Up-regulated during skeletal muscle growth protein 5 n=1 Tax=Liparis tanakae TaxID=230148 RepID=A0A4Z2J7Y5_9TELE|nr:Up-regulated during skeletal muscle growth protein 5 [Liparis tanakae]
MIRCDELYVLKAPVMPTSPVSTRIPITSFGHLITEVKKQLFGIEAPASVELTGLRKYFNSYTLKGRRNCVLATYGIFAVTAAAYWTHRQNKKEKPASDSPASGSPASSSPA